MKKEGRTTERERKKGRGRAGNTVGREREKAEREGGERRKGGTRRCHTGERETHMPNK